MSSRWCGVVVRRGVPAQVSSTSPDHGSKLRGPSPKALVQLNSATLIFTHSLTHATCSKKEVPALHPRGVAVISNTTPSHGAGYRINIEILNATVQQPPTRVSPNSNPTIVILQVEARFVRKHNVTPFRCPCPPLSTPLNGANAPVKGKRGNGRLADIPFSCK
ncbi:hypothetical protein TNCV_4384931 [Trichonephila clavipes]|nr:hypothetical protein TNCV_4384931 [Trichonephila clavipes]